MVTSVTIAQNSVGVPYPNGAKGFRLLHEELSVLWASHRGANDCAEGPLVGPPLSEQGFECLQSVVKTSEVEQRFRPSKSSFVVAGGKAERILERFEGEGSFLQQERDRSHL